MKNIIPEFKKVFKKEISVNDYHIVKHENFYFFYVYFYFTPENIIKFNEALPEIKNIAEDNNFYLLSELETDVMGDEYSKFVLKSKKKTPVRPKEKLYHISPKKNRKRILKKGLIPQPFENSRWIKNLNYYYEPATFCTKNKDDARFLFSKVKYDIWEIDLTGMDKKWFLDCNMLEDGFFMTFEGIKPEALKLLT
jgi:hypothetical protein